VGCTIGSRGKVPGERKPVIRWWWWWWWWWWLLRLGFFFHT